MENDKGLKLEGSYWYCMKKVISVFYKRRFFIPY